jgi:GNAT superfamily N-acetyltransferase
VIARTPGEGEAAYFWYVVSRLADGTPLVVRPIRPGDKALLADGLARLSEHSRHKRFLSPKARFTDSDLRYLTEVDGVDHVAYVALRGDAPTELVAVARLVRDKDDPTRAEIAVTVGDCWQRRGIGRMLGDRLAVAARDRDVRWLTATMAADNVAAHHLFDHVSTQLHLERDGAVDELWADLAAA